MAFQSLSSGEKQVLPKFVVMNHKFLYSYSYEVIASTKSL